MFKWFKNWCKREEERDFKEWCGKEIERELASPEPTIKYVTIPVQKEEIIHYNDIEIHVNGVTITFEHKFEEVEHQGFTKTFLKNYYSARVEEYDRNALHVHMGYFVQEVNDFSSILNLPCSPSGPILKTLRIPNSTVSIFNYTPKIIIRKYVGSQKVLETI